MSERMMAILIEHTGVYETRNTNTRGGGGGWGGVFG